MAVDARGLMALGAVGIRDRIASGALRAADVTRAFLDRIAARDGEVRAFAWVDPDTAIATAERLDRLRGTGRPVGPLHGLPVAVKDMIDTAGIPTENGTALDAGRVPVRDATLVSRLKAAGAFVIGKAVTAELAYLGPGPTRNPANLAHTPGGSSSGSAAAVADGMAPLAIGTQTGGSVIRPASYCGVVGYKPTFGAIPRGGVLSQSPSLDTIGVFAGSVADAALLADALFGWEPGDPATRPAAPPRLLDGAGSAPPLPPVLGLVDPPHGDRTDPQMRTAIAELAGLLGDSVARLALPSDSGRAVELRETINFAEMAKTYFGYERRGLDQLAAPLQEAMVRGREIRARDYLAALDARDVLSAALDPLFGECDALMLQAAPGPAPEGLGATGSSVFNCVWTMCGLPAITLPLLEAEGGLPMGVQLVGRRGDDARLLRTAAWLAGRVAELTGAEARVAEAG